MSNSDLFRLNDLWGNFCFDHVKSLANGRSGGIISIWDPQSFTLDSSFVFENFVVVKGTWVASNLNCYMVNVYAPQNENEKVNLWSNILDFMQSNVGRFLICGDFNSTRYRDERMGSSFSSLNANNFNDFINRGNLIDVVMGRHKYTRMSSDGLKASRLDRFSVNRPFLDSVPDIVMEALDDIISDHRPLLLKQKSLDFGPTPFKFYNSWMSEEGFDKLFSGAPGFIKGAYLKLPESLANGKPVSFFTRNEKIQKDGSSCASLGSNVSLKKTKALLEVGKSMGFDVCANPHSFAQFVNKMSDDKGFQ